MATKITNIMSEYELGGTGGKGLVNREDLSNVIYEISPTKTPFMSMIGREPIRGTLHEWNIDELEAAASNAQITGDDITASLGTVSATTRPVNSTQISTKSFGVSGTQEAVDKAGMRSAMAYQTARRGFELRRDIEFHVTQNSQRVAGTVTTSSGTARKARALEHWIQTNVQTVNGYSFTDETTALTDGTTPTTLTETMLKTAAGQCWDEGGEPTVLMCGKLKKQQIGGFAGNTNLSHTINQNVGPATLIHAVDIYVTDFFELRVVPNRFQRERTVFLLDLSMWAIGFLRPFMTIDLAKVGDAQRRAVLAEWTLVSRNEKASSKIADLKAV